MFRLFRQNVYLSLNLQSCDYCAVDFSLHVHFMCASFKCAACVQYIGTCPCALVTSCPVTPCRLERALPNTCDPAIEPIAAAAATAA